MNVSKLTHLDGILWHILIIYLKTHNILPGILVLLYRERKTGKWKIERQEDGKRERNRMKRRWKKRKIEWKSNRTRNRLKDGKKDRKMERKKKRKIYLSFFRPIGRREERERENLKLHQQKWIFSKRGSPFFIFGILHQLKPESKLL